MTTERAMIEEEVNWKKLALLFLQKIWNIVIFGVAGALIGSSLYLLITVVFSGPTQYEVEGGFYITFAEGVLDAHDYYNAYTWNSVVHQDQIMLDTMAQLEKQGITDIDREYVENAVTADILSDVRYLTITVTCDREEYATKIFDACEEALIHFGQSMDEFDSITLTHQRQAKAIVIPVMTWRAAFLGALCGVILAFLGFMLLYVLDDSIYLQEELQDRYGLFSFGMIMKYKKKKSASDEKWEEYCSNECAGNLMHKLSREQKTAFIIVEDIVKKKKRKAEAIAFVTNADVSIDSIDMPETIEGFDKLRNYAGVILGVPYGAKNGALLTKYIRDLQKQDCKILGAVLIEADSSFLKKYYGTHWI